MKARLDPNTFTLDQLGLDEKSANVFAQAHRPIETEQQNPLFVNTKRKSPKTPLFRRVK